MDRRDIGQGLNDSYTPTPVRRQTEGERRVRVSFNPSGDGVVGLIKNRTADLIDICETLKAKDPRLAALAQTKYEEACMWAVKAATAAEPPTR